jgi:hypothetical protein
VLPAQHFANSLDQPARGFRLVDVSGRSRSQHAFRVKRLVMHRDDENLDIGKLRIDLFAEFEPVAAFQ